VKLNSSQTIATEIMSGTAMVVAGAGCGKTRVITSRIFNLIKNNESDAQSIVALTFTNKAAREMSERINNDLLNHQVDRRPFIGTFHSYCFFLLKKYSSSFGLENFGILDSTDQQSIIKKILVRHGIDKEFQPRKVLGYISSHKNGMAATQENNSTHQSQLLEIYQEYERDKAASRNLDFDDLMTITFNKLKTDEILLGRIKQNIKHILIDEYQDTNAIQHNLIKLLATHKNSKQLSVQSLFAVGDQDQSIYSWRGAIPENINNFLESFEDVRLIKIEQNYRSAEQILTAANHVIKNNNRRQEKQLWSNDKTQNCIFVASCKNEYQEAEIVASSILKAKQQNSQTTCAVLYRNHHQSRLIEEALIQNKMQYNIIGGLKFYERKEIKDLLAYLKLIVNDRDWVSLDRVINCPTRHLGDKVLEKIQELSQIHENLNFQEILTELMPNLPQERQKVSLHNFLQIFTQQLIFLKPSMALQHIIDRTNYISYLEKEYDTIEADSKIKNVFELQKSIRTLEESMPDQEITTKIFLDEILIQESSIAEKGKKESEVQLMTLHSAKGLEFDFVTMIGLEEGNLPSLRKDTAQNIEEERRLVYVGITRAKAKLLITFCQNRNEYGRINSYDPSRFLEEIPKTFFEKNKQNISTSIVKNEISSWITNKPKITDLQNTYRSFIPSSEILKNQNTSTENNQINSNNKFSINHTISHKLFGVGIIKEIIMAGDAIILTIQFFNFGLKKINSLFVTKR
jgi:DNA helicase-2/ATP-dependent DNA helicase PcrA